MFCPNCGAANTTEQKFCRSCGLNLEKTAESLVEQLPTAQKANLLKQERRLETFGNIAFGGFGIVLLLGIAGLVYYIFTTMVLAGNQPLAGVLLINFIIFAALCLIYVVFREDLKEKKQKINPHIDKELEGTRDTGKLLDEGNLQPVSSVTEHSTDLLYDKLRTKKLD